MKNKLNDLYCRLATFEDFAEIHNLQKAYYDAFEQEVQVRENRIRWIVCVDGNDKIQGTYSYEIDPKLNALIVHDLYVTNTITGKLAIRILEQDFNALAKRNDLNNIQFMTNPRNITWNKALLKNNYKPIAIVYFKAIKERG